MMSWGWSYPHSFIPFEYLADERKLFIGMISKSTAEDDLRVIFSPYGTIEEVTVLKNQEGGSKGAQQKNYSGFPWHR